MSIFKFNTIKSYVTFLSAVIAILIGVYTLIPQVMASFNSIDRIQIERMLRIHDSFVNDGNIEGMLSLYHPDFSMDVVHSSGRKESFDISQISKHQETISLISSLFLKEISQQVSVVSNNQALVSVAMKQKLILKGLPFGNDELLYQSMLIENHDGKPKILKVLSTAIKIIPNNAMNR